VLCRIPELEYASSLVPSDHMLDHCCGDGRLAGLAWPGSKIAVGCDLDEKRVRRAAGTGSYGRVDVCDASERLPYGDGEFDLVFNNSALEHIADLDRALKEVARVLAPGGMFAFSVLNHRYFEWWPLDEAAMAAYKEWQPFHHALALGEWENRLSAAGMRVLSVEGYFDRDAARELAFLEHEFSGAYLAGRPSWTVRLYHGLPHVMRAYWRRRLRPLRWKTAPDAGAGYFIKAVHKDR